MKASEYHQAAMATAIYPNRGNNLIYPALGLTGEAGEVANLVKKVQRDNNNLVTPIMRERIKDELGDVLWYITATAEELGLTLEDIMEYNLEKLERRYAEKELENGTQDR